MTSSSMVPAGAMTLFAGELPAHAPQDHDVKRALPFPHGPDGAFAVDVPAREAVAQLEELRRRGATHLILPEQAAGSLAVGPELSHHLESRYRLAVDDAACRVFDLRPSPIGAFLDSILPAEEPAIAVLRPHSDLGLVGRTVHLAEVGQIEVMRAEGLRYLVVADMNPWAPDDTAILDHLERRFRKLAVRPGICTVFDLAPEASPSRRRKPGWRRLPPRFSRNG